MLKVYRPLGIVKTLSLTCSLNLKVLGLELGLGTHNGYHSMTTEATIKRLVPWPSLTSGSIHFISVLPSKNTRINKSSLPYQGWGVNKPEQSNGLVQLSAWPLG